MTFTPEVRKPTEADLRRAVVAAALNYCRMTRRAMVDKSRECQARWRQAHIALLGATHQLETFVAQAEKPRRTDARRK